jgi:succinyl-CoA synthetase beta subunit
MLLEEHAVKQLLIDGGIVVPRGRLAESPEQANLSARQLGVPVVVKAQITVGGRGKAGGIRFADRPEDAGAVATQMLGSTLRGHLVAQVLVEERIPIVRELYTAILDDTARKCPLLLFASEGGMDIEEIHAARPDKVMIAPLDIRRGLDEPCARELLRSTGTENDTSDLVADFLVRLYRLYRKLDAELLEINPLALTACGELVAVDCKLVIDDSALPRHPRLPVPRPRGTPLELRARAEGLLYVELEGDVAVLANGAGLTMSTMDAITFYGGRPANFMEIGGEAYKKAAIALSIVLAKPGVKALLVNLCGAFARTDVMADGIVKGWRELRPEIPVAFSIHGTEELEAIRLVRDELGIESYDDMDDAVRAAVHMARAGRREGRG